MVRREVPAGPAITHVCFAAQRAGRRLQIAAGPAEFGGPPGYTMVRPPARASGGSGGGTPRTRPGPEEQRG